MTSLTPLNHNDIPIELAEKIVELMDTRATLCTASLVSREFLKSARRALFAHIKIYCPFRLQYLVELLKSEYCSIPAVINTLEIRIYDPVIIKPLNRRAVRRITGRVNNLLQYIEARCSVTIDLEWVINAYPGWVTEYYVPSSVRFNRIESWSMLRHLSIEGHFSHLKNLVAAISQLCSLTSLKVFALWKNDDVPVVGYLSPFLTELEVNSSSLGILGWITSLQQSCDSLRVLRVEAKTEFFEDFSHLHMFVRRFGAILTDVSFKMYPRSVLVEWARYLPFFTNLEHITFWIQRHISLPSYRSLLRRWGSKLNSDKLKTITLRHRDWYMDCQARKLCKWSLQYEALNAPDDVDKVKIICAIDRSLLLPGDYEAHSLGLWDDSDEEDDSSGQDDGEDEEDDGPGQNDGEDEADEGHTEEEEEDIGWYKGEECMEGHSKTEDQEGTEGSYEELREFQEGGHEEGQECEQCDCKEGDVGHEGNPWL